MAILFGTDTADANALHDYEEGTYTPYLGASGNYSSTGMALGYTTQYGAYVKIGHIVVVSVTLAWSSKSGSNSSNNNDLTLTLPFNVGNMNFNGSGTVSYNSAIDYNADARGLHLVNGGSIMYFDNVSQGSAKHSGYVGSENVASSGQFRLGLVYMTTA